jgi:lysyl-tRNA synthetase class I
MAWIHLAEDRDKWQACEHGNEPSGSIKCGEFLDLLKTVIVSKELCSIK